MNHTCKISKVIFLQIGLKTEYILKPQITYCLFYIPNIDKRYYVSLNRNQVQKTDSLLRIDLKRERHQRHGATRNTNSVVLTQEITYAFYENAR